MILEEPAVLRHRDGRTVAATARVRRYSTTRRGITAAAILLVAFTVGPATIIIPGVHFVAPWLIPLLGIGIALYLYRRKLVVFSVSGPCPDCGVDMSIDDCGSVGNDPLWLRCSGCNTPLEFVTETA